MARPRSFDESEVLAKARDQFWKEGYTATSIQDLEQATGLVRTSLYQAFGDKRTLYEKSLRSYQGDAQAYLRSVTASAKTFLEAVERIFRDAVDQLGSCSSKKGCFITNATAELSSVDDAIKRFALENKQQFIEILLPLASLDSNHRPVSSPEARCAYVFTLYGGLNLLAKSGACRDELNDVVEVGLAALRNQPSD